MVGVGDDEAVLSHRVENRKAIGSEGADATRGFFFELGNRARESGLAMGQRGYPQIGKLGSDDELGRRWTIRIDGDIIRRFVDDERRGTPLNATKVKIGLVIDTPHLVGNEPSILI